MVRYTKIPEPQLESIEKICVICWGLIGDVFIRIPLLEALRSRFPNAYITVIVDPSGAVALENHPAVAELIKLNRKTRPFIKYAKQTLSTYYYLNRKRFDLSVDLYCGGSSPMLTRFIHARFRICYDHKPSLRRANNYLVEHLGFCNNWTLELGNLLLPLGIKGVRRGTSYYCNETACEFADRWLADKPDKRLVLNLGAGAENKIWDIEKYVKLVWQIQQSYGYFPIILTNPGQDHLVDKFKTAVSEMIPESTFMYAVLPQTSFANVAAVISRVGLIITGDTSIMHLAFGLKCPTLGIFTRTRPEVIDPEDCIHVACFKQGTEEDRCGKLFGTQELTPDTCFDRFEELLSVIRQKDSNA